MANCWCARRTARPRPSTTCSNASIARKSIAQRSEKYPAFIRAYDLLADADDDLRALPFKERRVKLEDFILRTSSPRIDISPLVEARDWDALAQARADPPEAAIEGLMLKRWDFRLRTRPPQGPVVQVETRSAHGRRRADVRAAGGTANAVRSIPITRSASGAKANPAPNSRPSAKPISASPTKNWRRSINSFATTPRSASARCAPFAPIKHSGSCSRSHSRDLARSTRHKSGVAMRVSARQTHPLGQARRRSGQSGPVRSATLTAGTNRRAQRGSASLISSAISPGPSCAPAAPCIHTARACRLPHRHALRDQAGNDACQRVARTRRGQKRRRVDVHRRPAIRRGDDRIRSLAYDRAASARGKRRACSEACAPAGRYQETDGEIRLHAASAHSVRAARRTRTPDHSQTM